MIDRSTDRPAYRRLADLLRARIESGDLAPGDRLPAEHALAGEHGVSRDTVRDALAVLRQDGLVASKKGSGAYVRGLPETEPVRVRPEVEVHSRMPTEQEREQLELGEGVPVTVVTVDGDEQVFPGWTRLRL